jgi:hypothetical protein
MEVETGLEVKLHSFIPSTLNGVDWFTSQPSLFTTEEEQRYILKEEAKYIQRRFGRFGKEGSVLSLPGFETWILQPVV